MKVNYALFDNVLPVNEIRESENGSALHAQELQLSFYEEQAFASENKTLNNLTVRNRNDAANTRLVRAVKAVKLQEAPTEPGTYYVTSTLEKVGERQLLERIVTIQDAANATAYLSRYAVEHYDAIVTDKKGKPLAVIGSFIPSPRESPRLSHGRAGPTR